MGCAGCDKKINRKAMKKRREEGRTKRWARGAKGLAKAALQMDKAPATLVHERRGICHACEHLRNGRCDICKCFILAKGRLLSEDCPKGKWPQE
jgi:hypothetical protein